MSAADLPPARDDSAERLIGTAAAEGLETARALRNRLEREDGDSLVDAWITALKAEVRRRLGVGDSEAAEALAREGLQEAEDGYLWQVMGYLEHRTGRIEQAVASCARAVELGVEDWSNYYVWGLGLQALRRDVDARNAFSHAHRLSPLRLDAAGAYLETTLAVDGLEAAQALWRNLSQVVAEPGLDRLWFQLIERYEPPAIAEHLARGDIDGAEAEARRILDAYATRRVHMMLENLKTYRAWLAATSAQRSRDIPGRKPSLSILLITYNHGRFIAQALEGILTQETEFDYEINVVDDCSSDDTQAIVLEYQARYPGRINTYFNKTNIGTLDPPQQKVTYAGFKTLKGDYIAILEGDDYWSSPHKIQKQIAFLEANPLYVGTCHNTLKIYDDGKTAPHRFLYWAGTKADHTVDDATEMRTFFHTSSIIFRNLNMDGPPKFFASKWACDISFSMAHLQHGKMRYFDEDMSVYRAHAGGAYSTLPALTGRIFNIEGLLRYNGWLSYRYMKAFMFSINRLTLQMLHDSRQGLLPELTARQSRRYRAIARVTGWIYDLIDRHPRLDPAVFRFREPPKPSRPRKALLEEYKLS